MANSVLVWVDLELTGLKPTDQIIEIAVLLSDLRCTQLTEGPNLVIHAEDSQLQGMCEYVQNMHASSGLTELVRQSTLTVREAEDQVLEFLQQHGVRGGILAGSSIHWDRKFLLRGMPRLFEEAINPLEVFNVSSINRVSSVWYKKYFPPGKKSSHRSIDDIRESIEEYRFYLETIIKQP